MDNVNTILLLIIIICIGLYYYVEYYINNRDTNKKKYTDIIKDISIGTIILLLIYNFLTYVMKYNSESINKTNILGIKTEDVINDNLLVDTDMEHYNEDVGIERAKF